MRGGAKRWVVVVGGGRWAGRGGAGHLKLADFGLARPLLPGSRAHTRCGTDEYLPPELLANKGAGFAGDWWALGVRF